MKIEFLKLSGMGIELLRNYSEKNSKLYSGNGLSFSKAYKKVYYEIVKIKTNAIIDGEILVVDETGKPNFQNMHK